MKINQHCLVNEWYGNELCKFKYFSVSFLFLTEASLLTKYRSHVPTVQPLPTTSDSAYARWRLLWSALHIAPAQLREMCWWLWHTGFLLSFSLVINCMLIVRLCSPKEPAIQNQALRKDWGPFSRSVHKRSLRGNRAIKNGSLSPWKWHVEKNCTLPAQNSSET